MADLDPFELVRRLRDAPLGPLVDALRHIHGRGTADPASLDDLLRSRETTPSAPEQPGGTASNSPDYEAARRHFVRHSERLREQAILAERLLDGLTGSANRTTPVILQQELRVPCTEAGTSRARFVVVNSLERTVDVHFRPGRVHGLSGEQAALIHFSFDPEQPRLEPGAEQEVALLVGIDDADGLADVLELGVDVWGNEQLLFKLWVRIELRAGGAE
jgi:hypothetical protein